MMWLKCKVSDCVASFSPHQIERSDAHADASPEVSVRVLLLLCNFRDIFQSLTISVMETTLCSSAQVSSERFCIICGVSIIFFNK